MRYPELSSGGVKVTVPDPEIVSVWIPSPAGDIPPTIPWDESWVVPRIADRINLGATQGYSLTIADDQLVTHPSYPFDVFETDGSGGFHAANDGSTLAFCGTNPVIPVTVGRIYEITFRGDLIVGSGYGIAIVNGIGAGVIDGTNDDPESWGQVDGLCRKFFTATSTRNVAVMFATSFVGTPREYRCSDIKIREIIPTEKFDHIYWQICCWGDSHTAGIYPSRLRNYVTNCTIYNGGVGGEGSTEIKDRFMAAPEKFPQPHLIWSGNNNTYEPAAVLADIAAMVSAMGHGRYRIIGLMGSNEATAGSTYRANIDAINLELARRYGPKFIDIEQYIIGMYDPLNPQDVVDYANGVTPSSLRVDPTHLRHDGYDLVVAKLLESFPDFFIYDPIYPPA